MSLYTYTQSCECLTIRYIQTFIKICPNRGRAFFFELLVELLCHFSECCHLVCGDLLWVGIIKQSNCIENKLKAFH